MNIKKIIKNTQDNVEDLRISPPPMTISFQRLLNYSNLHTLADSTPKR